MPRFPGSIITTDRQLANWRGGFAKTNSPIPRCICRSRKTSWPDSRYERQDALDELKRCLELSDLLRLRFVVLHLGKPHQDFNPAGFEHAYAAVATVQSFSGALVLLETLPNGFATFARITEFRSAAQLPDVGICYDTGHGEMDGTCDAIHLNDNDGADDAHLWPFDGARNGPRWLNVSGRLFTGPLILEGVTTGSKEPRPAVVA